MLNMVRNGRVVTWQLMRLHIATTHQTMGVWLTVIGLVQHKRIGGSEKRAISKSAGGHHSERDSYARGFFFLNFHCERFLIVVICVFQPMLMSFQRQGKSTVALRVIRNLNPLFSVLSPRLY